MKIKNRKNNFEKNKNSVTLYHGGCCCCCSCVNAISTTLYADNTFLKNSKYPFLWAMLILIVVGSIEFFSITYFIRHGLIISLYIGGSLALMILYVILAKRYKKDKK